jgi:hypothetical protein
MNEDKPIRLIRACTEDTAILTALLRWFENERESVKERLADATLDLEIHRLQGEARCLRRLGKLMPTWTREKGAVDEQSRLRSVR